MHAGKLQVELAVAAANGELHRGNADLKTVCRPVERLLDIGGKPTEFDRALGQAPQAEPNHQDERRGQRRHPRQEAMRPTPHPQRGRVGTRGRRRYLARGVARLIGAEPGNRLVLTESL